MLKKETEDRESPRREWQTKDSSVEDQCPKTPKRKGLHFSKSKDVDGQKTPKKKSMSNLKSKDGADHPRSPKKGAKSGKQDKGELENPKTPSRRRGMGMFGFGRKREVNVMDAEPGVIHHQDQHAGSTSVSHREVEANGQQHQRYIVDPDIFSPDELKRINERLHENDYHQQVVSPAPFSHRGSGEVGINSRQHQIYHQEDTDPASCPRLEVLYAPFPPPAFPPPSYPPPPTPVEIQDPRYQSDGITPVI